MRIRHLPRGKQVALCLSAQQAVGVCDVDAGEQGRGPITSAWRRTTASCASTHISRPSPRSMHSLPSIGSRPPSRMRHGPIGGCSTTIPGPTGL